MQLSVGVDGGGDQSGVGRKRVDATQQEVDGAGGTHRDGLKADVVGGGHGLPHLFIRRECGYGIPELCRQRVGGGGHQR